MRAASRLVALALREIGRAVEAETERRGFIGLRELEHTVLITRGDARVLTAA